MTLLDDTLQHAPWLITQWGTQLAIGFRGDQPYLQRCFNWAHNQSVTYGALHYPFDRAGSLAYILVREKRNDKDQITTPSLHYLMAGLRAQFRGEIMMAREVPPLATRSIPSDEPDVDPTPTVEEDWDEARIDALAAARADQFLADHVIWTNFLRAATASVAPVYEAATPSPSASSDGETD